MIERLEPQEAIGADKAYVGADVRFPRSCFYVPMKKPPHGERTEEDTLYNRALASVRMVVEHCFARMSRFGALAQVWRHRREAQERDLPRGRLAGGPAHRRRGRTAAVCLGRSGPRRRPPQLLFHRSSIDRLQFVEFFQGATESPRRAKRDRNSIDVQFASNNLGSRINLDRDTR